MSALIKDLVMAVQFESKHVAVNKSINPGVVCVCVLCVLCVSCWIYLDRVKQNERVVKCS